MGVASYRFLSHAIRFMWQYGDSQISMLVVDALVPIWHKDICNHCDHGGRSVYIRRVEHNIWHLQDTMGRLHYSMAHSVLSWWSVNYIKPSAAPYIYVFICIYIYIYIRTHLHRTCKFSLIVCFRFIVMRLIIKATTFVTDIVVLSERVHLLESRNWTNACNTVICRNSLSFISLNTMPFQCYFLIFNQGRLPVFCVSNKMLNSTV